MSLQDAANYFNQRRNSPVERGLAAGRAAYEGNRALSTPLRSGIGAVPIANVRSSVEQALADSARQRQVLADTAQKQALGLYPNTGTSAAAYDYLRGRPGAKYPVNPVLAGQPGSALTSPTVSRPYEDATRVGGRTQTEVSKTAKDTPSIMPTVSRAAPAMAKPGLFDQLLGLALPGYLLYKGYNWLTGPSAAEAGISSAAALNPYAAYTATSPAPFSAGIVESTPIAPMAADAGAGATTVADAGATTTADVASGQAVGDIGGTTTPYTAEQASAVVGASGISPEVLEAANASGDPIAYLAETQGWTTAQAEAATSAAGAAGTEGSLFAGVDPTTAAIVAVLSMTPEGQGLIKDTTQNLQSVLSGAEDTTRSLLSQGEDTVKSVFSSFGIDIAKGGNVDDYTKKGISAALPDRYNLGGYSDGGRLLKGPGDGVSDSIPATIGKNRQPARLADGEFVVPARIVSELGNGSTEAGARKLYAMMDRIQASRKKSIGKGRVAVNNRADKYLPK